MADDLKKTGVQLVAEGSAAFERTMDRARGQVTAFGQDARQTSLTWRDGMRAIGAATAVTMGAITAGVALAGKVYRATVGEAMEYAEAVGSTSRALGINAEEASRVIQVLDDFNISQSEATASMRIALQQGIVPNIQGLADISTHYLSLSNTTDKAAYAQQIFGRNWMAMTRVLEAGAPAILNMSAGIEGGLILTDEAIRRTEEYRLQVDELSDRWMAFKVSMGTAIIPPLSRYLEALNASMKDLSLWDPRRILVFLQEFGNFPITQAEGFAQAGRDIAGGWDEGARALQEYAIALGGVDGAADGATEAMRLFSDEQLLAAVAADTNSRMIGLEREAIEALRDRNIVVTVTTIRREIQYMLRAGQAGATGMAGFQHGGSFMVGGPGGADRSPVSFMATRGERVIVMPPQASPGASSYSDSHDQRTNNVSIQGQDLSNPFVVKRLFDQWLQGG